MNATNLTVTSREYKLMLRPDRFDRRKRGASSFWSLIKFLAQERQHAEIFKEQDDEFRRKTWYVDTPAGELNKHAAILRVREQAGAEKPFKVTLKFRSSDRYVGASQNVECSREIGSKDDKFEEDILPPFSSKFSRSVSFEDDKLPALATVGQAAEIFPGFKKLGIPLDTCLGIVNGFQACEVAQHIGQLRFVRSPLERADKPDFLVKCCLTFWYLQSEDDDWPLTAEFSFDYDLPDVDEDKRDKLEKFSPEVVAGTNAFFRALQQQSGWMAPNDTTKTAFAYEME